jgi:hypothetical protein
VIETTAAASKSAHAVPDSLSTERTNQTTMLEPEKANVKQARDAADRGPVVRSKRAKGAKSLGRKQRSKAHPPNAAPPNNALDSAETMMKGLRRLTLSKAHQPMDRLMKIMGELDL